MGYTVLPQINNVNGANDVYKHIIVGCHFLNTNPIELHDMNQSNESHVMEE